MIFIPGDGDMSVSPCRVLAPTYSRTLFSPLSQRGANFLFPDAWENYRDAIPEVCTECYMSDIESQNLIYAWPHGFTLTPPVHHQIELDS